MKSVPIPVRAQTIKRFWLQQFLVLLLTLLFAQMLQAADFSISPILIEREVMAGSEFQFEFQVKAKSPTRVTVQPYDMKQLESGHMIFHQADQGVAKRRSKKPSSWVRLGKTKFKLARNQRTLIQGKVVLPKNIQGTQLIALMVEENRAAKQKGGVKIKVRYAVTLKIRVPSLKKQRNKGSASEAHLVSLKGKQLVIAGHFQNQSKHDFRIKAEAQIRDSNKKLIEKIQLKTRSAWERKDPSSWVFPGAEVGLIGPIQKITKPGTYHLSIRYRLGDKKQVYFKKQLHVTAQMLPKAKLVAGNQRIKMTPQVLDVRFKKNNTSFNTFVVENEGQDLLTIKLPDSVLTKGKASFQFIPAEIKLKPGARKRIILKQFSPDKKQPQEKYVVWVQQGAKKVQKLNLVTHVQP